MSMLWLVVHVKMVKRKESRAFAIKLFTTALIRIYKLHRLSLSHPSLIFADKAGAYPNRAS
jgi:hypothetical protein